MRTSAEMPLMRLAGLSLAAALLIAGCGGKPPAQQADQLVKQALVAQSSGNVDEAIRLYRAAIAKDPNDKVAHFDLGYALAQQNNLSEAESEYRAALRIDPNFESALFNLAIVRTTLGGKPEAADLYKRLIAANPNYATAYLNLGFLLRDMNQKALGDRYLAKAVLLDASLRSRLPAEDPIPRGTKPI